MKTTGIPGHVCVTESQSFRFALEKENGKWKKEKERLEAGAQNKWKISEEVGARKDAFFPQIPLNLLPPPPPPLMHCAIWKLRAGNSRKKIQKIKLRFEPPTTARFHFWVLGLFVIWIASGVGCSAAPKHHQPVNQSSVKKIQDSKIKDSVYLPFYLKYELFIYKNYTSRWSVYAQWFFFCWNINCYVCFHPRVALTRD